MKLAQKPFHRAADSTAAEQSLIGCVLIHNDSIDRVGALQPAHFYSREHQLIFAEIRRQIATGKTCDAITVYEVLNTQVADCMPYLNSCAQSVGSTAGIERYATTIMDRAAKRDMGKIASEMLELQESGEPAADIIDRMVSRLEGMIHEQTDQEPEMLCDSLAAYVETLTARMEGTIKPISTGFVALDEQMGGGIDRGTVTVVAGRPSSGKTALGLCLSRNVAEWGSSLFLSMEMKKTIVNDRNVSAMAQVPLLWLRKPMGNTPEEQGHWSRVTHAFAKSQDMAMFIDDQTGLSLLKIRAKARSVKRRKGLDLLVIDQLSFITGSEADKSYEAVGEYTRGLMALARELDIGIILLCQLNRKLEERQNKRPMMSDLAMSGSIEQDAENIIFLYRDEVYNPDSRDKGIAEIIIAKQRQGRTGTIGLSYIGEQTRFEDLKQPWKPDQQQDTKKPRF